MLGMYMYGKKNKFQAKKLGRTTPPRRRRKFYSSVASGDKVPYLTLCSTTS